MNKSDLRKIIKEEIQSVVKEDFNDFLKYRHGIGMTKYDNMTYLKTITEIHAVLATELKWTKGDKIEKISEKIMDVVEQHYREK